MPTLTPNICGRGRLLRGALGGVFVLLGALWMVGAGPEIGGPVRWGGGGALAGLGLFCLFEARKRWCVVRALGFRTPL